MTKKNRYATATGLILLAVMLSRSPAGQDAPSTGKDAGAGDCDLVHKAKQIQEEQKRKVIILRKKVQVLPLSVNWLKDEAEAKATGKPIFYFVTRSQGCAPCEVAKKMMATPMFAKESERYACLKMVDVPASHPWMKFYGIGSTPQFLIVGKYGAVRTALPGYGAKGEAELLQFLSINYDRVTQPAKQTARRVTGPVACTNPACRCKPCRCTPCRCGAVPDLADPATLETSGRDGTTAASEEQSIVWAKARRGRTYWRRGTLFNPGFRPQPRFFYS
jgi:thioredoxin-related protein